MIRRVLPIVGVLMAAFLARPTPGVETWTPPAGSPLAMREHPRIWMTKSSLPSIRARLATGGPYHAEFQAWVRSLDSVYEGALNQPDRFVAFLAVDYAFLYRLGPVGGVTEQHSAADYGARAKACLLKLTSPGGFAAAVGYDWVNDQLSMSDKQAVVALLRQATQQPFAGPVGDPFNAEVPVNRSPVVLAGLAFAGDGIDDATAASMYGNYPTLIAGDQGPLAAENWWAATDGGAGEGYSYTTGTMAALLPTVEAWRTANGLSMADVYTSANYFRYFPQLTAYLLLPHAGGSSGLLWKTYAMNAAQTVNSYGDNYLLLPALAGIYAQIDPDMAALAQWLSRTQLGPMPTSTGVVSLQDGPFLFLTGTKTVQPKSPSALTLPLSKAFRSGWVAMRTGWDSVSDTLVTFAASPFARNGTIAYTNTDPGSFTIHRKGPQVIDQGYAIHDVTNGVTWSRNTLIFPDYSDVPPALSARFADLGGHKAAYGPITSYRQLTEGSAFDERDDFRFLPADVSAGRDVDYVSADVTRAYNSTLGTDGYNPPKISRFVRDVVYLHPGTPGLDPDLVITYDRVSTVDTKFHKEWLLHTAAEPIVNGTETAGQPVRNGTGQGHWSYTGAHLITATNTANGANGRVFCTILLPANPAIVKVGGPNSKGVSFTIDSHEFEDPYGRQGSMQGVPPAAVVPHVGQYRVEVSPSTSALDDTFLAVIEAADAKVSTPISTTLLTGAGIAAARIGGHVVAFAAQPGDLTSGQFTIDAPGVYRIHVADLVRGAQYSVTTGNTTTTMTASPEGGTLYFPVTVVSATVISIRATGGGAIGGRPPAGTLPIDR